MIISVNWLKKFVPIDGSVDELAALIGTRLVEIEQIIDLGAKYKDVVVAKVVEAGPLEGSGHLNVTKIDDGGVVKDVERDNNGLVQVVCGAPNVRAGMLVAWLPPRSVVPETFNADEPFVLSAKPLRGVMSNGMLASARELDLYDEHTGILEIDKDAAPGASFAELYELDDYLLDIENKSLTHRPDAFGVIGFAREVAGIQGKKFETPSWLSDLAPHIEAESSLTIPKVRIESAELSGRFGFIVVSGASEAQQSSVQLQTYLARSGVRPVNALVDVSNYLMLLTGQPTHAYDYEKTKAIAGDDFTLGVRLARAGETLTLLDGKEIELDATDIVITAGATAVGLAGIMGGASTATDASTTSILLEAATFDLYRMRASQMRHGIFSEAVTRFTKGVPASLSAPVAAEAVRMLADATGAKAASTFVDEYPGQREAITVEVSEQHINDTLGTQFTAEDIVELLENVGFSVHINGLNATATVPYWREDIHIAEDIIEEIGRLSGFDTINVTLPMRESVAVRPSTFDTLRSEIRQRLVRAGANEVLTYSFVHSDLLTKAGQNPADAYRIINSISPDLQYYRLSLTPSLLAHVHPNTKAGYDTFALFECNKVHRKYDGLNDEGVPVETDRIALVLSDARAKGSAYFQAKSLLEYILALYGVQLAYLPLDTTMVEASVFEPKRSAQLTDTATGAVIGVLGEFKRSVQKAFKLSERTAGFEIDPRALLEVAQKVGQRYRPLSRYPGTERDICFQVAQDLPYGQLYAAASAATEKTGLITTVDPVDIYKAEGADTKNITLRIKLTSYEKTMTAEEVNEVIQSVIDEVVKATDGKVV